MIRAKVLATFAAVPLLASIGLGIPAQAVEPVTISGTTWFDENFDGVRQDAEGALWKFHVRVEKAGTAEVVAEGKTGVGGQYSFTDLAPGQYEVIMAGTSTRTPTRPNVGDDRTDSDIDQIYGQSQVLDCTGGPCGAVDGGYAKAELDVGIEVTPNQAHLPPQGRETVKVVVTNAGTSPWNAPVYLPPQGVTVENPHGEGWYCIMADPSRPNCTPTGTMLMPDESRELWFDVVATDAPSGSVDVSVGPDYDEDPSNNHGLVEVTVG